MKRSSRTKVRKSHKTRYVSNCDEFPPPIFVFLLAPDRCRRQSSRGADVSLAASSVGPEAPAKGSSRDATAIPVDVRLRFRATGRATWRRRLLSPSAWSAARWPRFCFPGRLVAMREVAGLCMVQLPGNLVRVALLPARRLPVMRQRRLVREASGLICSCANR